MSLTGEDLDRIEREVGDPETEKYLLRLHAEELVAEVRRLRSVIEAAGGNRDGWQVVLVPNRIADHLVGLPGGGRGELEQIATVLDAWRRASPPAVDTGTGRWSEVEPGKWVTNDRLCMWTEFGVEGATRSLTPADYRDLARIIENTEGT